MAYIDWGIISNFSHIVEILPSSGAEKLYLKIT